MFRPDMTGENAPGRTSVLNENPCEEESAESTGEQQQRILQDRIRGREAELDHPARRAELVAQLAREVRMDSDFIDGFLLALKDPNSEPFEKRATLRLPALEEDLDVSGSEPPSGGAD